MSKRKSRYHGHRFPPAVISDAIWAYHRFCLSLRDVEELLAQRGVIVSYESIRRWCFKFGPQTPRRLKRREDRLADTWHVDEVFIRIQRKVHYLWRAVGQDGDVIDVLVQGRRDAKAAKRFFKKSIKGQGAGPLRLTADALKSYPSAPARHCPERTMTRASTPTTEQRCRINPPVTRRNVSCRSTLE